MQKVVQGLIFGVVERQSMSSPAVLLTTSKRHSPLYRYVPASPTEDRAKGLVEGTTVATLEHRHQLMNAEITVDNNFELFETQRIEEMKVQAFSRHSIPVLSAAFSCQVYREEVESWATSAELATCISGYAKLWLLRWPTHHTSTDAGLIMVHIITRRRHIMHHDETQALARRIGMASSAVGTVQFLSARKTRSYSIS